MEKIKCPYCNYEYLPGEIYLPREFLGQTANVIRDDSGVIIAYEMSGDMDLHEEYRCDRCGGKFAVDADVSFKTIQLESSHPDVYTVQL